MSNISPSKTDSNEASYRAAWTRWNSFNGAPGACDKGGDVNACYGTDQAVRPLLTTLLKDLETVIVPPQYAKANQSMLSAINAESRGLTDRDFEISHDDHASFSRAFDELHAAGPQLVPACNTFPSGDRPAPAEFGPNRHTS